MNGPASSASREQENLQELVTLMGHLARLSSPRSSTPPSLRRGYMTQAVTEYAVRHNESWAWCEAVLQSMNKDAARHTVARAA